MEPSSDVPVVFGVFFVLVLVLGVGGTIWRASNARQMAQRAGLDPDDAVTATLLSDHGYEAAYLAAQLRPTEPASTPTEVPATTAERLRELRSLLDEGLITQAEHDARRRAIIDSV